MKTALAFATKSELDVHDAAPFLPANEAESGKEVIAAM